MCRDGSQEAPCAATPEHYELFTGDQGPLRGITASNAAASPTCTMPPTTPFARCSTSSADRSPTSVCTPRTAATGSLSDLRRHFARGRRDSAAEILLRRMNLRNTPLLDAMIRSRGEDTVFTLRGQQKKVADERPATSRPGSAAIPTGPLLIPDERRAVFLVTGGAGTGKSAIGLQLKADFEAAGTNSQVRQRQPGLQRGNAGACGLRRHGVQEELHLLQQLRHPTRPSAGRPDLRRGPSPAGPIHQHASASRRSQGTQPQVDELLDASRLTVFFLDESQSVRPKEVGTVSLIEEAARARRCRACSATGSGSNSAAGAATPTSAGCGLPSAIDAGTGASGPPTV